MLNTVVSTVGIGLDHYSFKKKIIAAYSKAIFLPDTPNFIIIAWELCYLDCHFESTQLRVIFWTVHHKNPEWIQSRNRPLGPLEVQIDVVNP